MCLTGGIFDSLSVGELAGSLVGKAFGILDSSSIGDFDGEFVSDTTDIVDHRV